MWLCGYVVMRLYGYVPLPLNIPTPTPAPDHLYVLIANSQYWLLMSDVWCFLLGAEGLGCAGMDISPALGRAQGPPSHKPWTTSCWPLRGMVSSMWVDYFFLRFCLSCQSSQSSPQVAQVRFMHQDFLRFTPLSTKVPTPLCRQSFINCYNFPINCVSESYFRSFGYTQTIFWGPNLEHRKRARNHISEQSDFTKHINYAKHRNTSIRPPIQSMGPPMRMQGWESVQKGDSTIWLKGPLISRK